MRRLGDLPGWLLRRRRVSGARGAVMVRGGGGFGEGGGGRGVVFLEAEEVGVGRGGGCGGGGGGFGRIGAEELGAEEAGVGRVVLGRGERGVEEREVLEAGGGAAGDEAVAVGGLGRGGRLGRLGEAAGGGRRRGPRPQPHGVEAERGRHGRWHIEARLGVRGRRRERHGGLLEMVASAALPPWISRSRSRSLPDKQGRASIEGREGKGSGKGGLEERKRQATTVTSRFVGRWTSRWMGYGPIPLRARLKAHRFTDFSCFIPPFFQK